MVDKSRSRKEHGAGLGLALCQRIAAIHGADLTFESLEGMGTTVEVLLPVDEEVEK
jgi:signal transduction histidine kinase